MTTNFNDRKGVVYFSQFKPTAPYVLTDDIVIVPSGGLMLPMHNGASIWMSRSYFVAPADWADNVVSERFRDWLVFDCFTMMNNHGTAHYDDNRHVVEIIPNSNDGSDQRNALDYGDVIGFLVGEPFAKPKDLPVMSYANLYCAFLMLPPEIRSAIEWFVSQPPSPRRFDPFFGSYWGLLHMTILIENLIGLPPTCERPFAECEVCKAPSRPHYKVSRKRWLRQELAYRMGGTQLAEDYASVIEKAKSVRDNMSHRPHFDRSTIPFINVGQTASYGVDRAINEYKFDSNALLALLISLRGIAHALLVDQAFGIKHFTPLPELKVTTIGSIRSK